MARLYNNPTIKPINNLRFSDINKSNIHGHGLFAEYDIKKHILLGILDGQWINYQTTKEIEEFLKTNNKNIDDIEWNRVLPTLLLVRFYPTKYKYINHSNNPNLKILKSPYRIMTLRDIFEGEELLLDYTEEFFPNDYLLNHGKTYLFPNNTTYEEFLNYFEKNEIYSTYLNSTFILTIFKTKDNKINFLFFDNKKGQAFRKGRYEEEFNTIIINISDEYFVEEIHFNSKINQVINYMRLYLQKENISIITIENSQIFRKNSLKNYLENEINHNKLFNLPKLNKDLLFNLLIFENFSDKEIRDINKLISYQLNQLIETNTFLPNKNMLDKFFEKGEKLILFKFEEPIDLTFDTENIIKNEQQRWIFINDEEEKNINYTDIKMKSNWHTEFNNGFKDIIDIVEQLNIKKIEEVEEDTEIEEIIQNILNETDEQIDIFDDLEDEFYFSEKFKNSLIKEKKLKDKITGSNYQPSLIKIKNIEKGIFIFSDFNNLKIINDEYNHNLGDEILNEVVEEFINEFINAYHFRIGGDEFCHVFEIKHYRSAISFLKYFQEEEFSNNIKKRIFKKHNIVIKGSINLSLSCGYTIFDKNDLNYKQMFEETETKMKINKLWNHITYGFYDRNRKQFIKGIDNNDEKIIKQEVEKIIKLWNNEQILSLLDKIKIEMLQKTFNVNNIFNL